MKPKFFWTFPTVAVVIFLSFQARTSRANAFTNVYVWHNNDDTTEEGGWLFLDAPSSTHGSLSDISPDSFITVHEITGPTRIYFMQSPFTVTLSDPVFSWNASGITEMDISFTARDSSFIQGGHIAENEPVQFDSNVVNFTLEYAPPNAGFIADTEDNGGSWVAPDTIVPEAGDSCLLFLIAMMALAGLKRYKGLKRIAT